MSLRRSQLEDSKNILFVSIRIRKYKRPRLKNSIFGKRHRKLQDTVSKHKTTYNTLTAFKLEQHAEHNNKG